MLHGSLRPERWRQLSRVEQLANIGSEVERTIGFHQRHDDRADLAFERALELIDLSLADRRWGKGRKELTRLRELFCDHYLGYHEYGDDSAWFGRYFMPFYLAARA